MKRIELNSIHKIRNIGLDFFSFILYSCRSYFFSYILLQSSKQSRNTKRLIFITNWNIKRGRIIFLDDRSIEKGKLCDKSRFLLLDCRIVLSKDLINILSFLLFVCLSPINSTSTTNRYFSSIINRDFAILVLIDWFLTAFRWLKQTKKCSLWSIIKRFEFEFELIESIRGTFKEIIKTTYMLIYMFILDSSSIWFDFLEVQIKQREMFISGEA